MTIGSASLNALSPTLCVASDPGSGTGQAPLARAAAFLVLTIVAFGHGSVRAEDRPAGARYDCGWVAAAARCAPVEDAVGGLGEAAEAHAVSSPFGPDDATWTQMLTAVRRARTELDPERLSFRERVAAQNAALRIARTVIGHTSGRETDLTRALLGEAAGLVNWLALAPDRYRSGEADAEMALWLGPAAAWHEERLEGDPVLFHEGVYLSTRAFRMVRVGDRHFIFSQLVAVDSDWRPQVTSVVGDMEMRRDGGAGMTACIAAFDSAWARCGAPAALRTLDRLPISHLGGYVRVEADGGANCASCHVGGQVLGRTPLRVPAANVADHLAQRRARLLAELAADLEAIRLAAGKPPD